ncbi:MAG: S-adenosylmethionine:tRNA ribosyltransferase-isomerase, partial [Cyanobacteria bacterium Co-bin8]|nr:S-adenosylmethionine:tRNA ribosyltransferase-isomerase [Cyanobacteria bacterium Co-bin8]
MGGSNHPEIDRENTNPAIIQRLDSSPPAPSGSASQHFPESNYSLTGYEYDLPPEKIAQNPVTPRDHSRLLVVDSPTTHQHRIFRDLPDLLRPGDLLVLNNTRVIPARLYGHKANGSSVVEVLLLEAQAPQRWSALVRPGRRLKPGATIHFGRSWDAPELVAQV